MSTKIIREFSQLDSSKKRRTFVEYECDHCQKLKSKPKRFFNDRNFCSSICRNKHDQKGRIETECSFCHKSLSLTPDRHSKSKTGFHFCSCKCKNFALRIEDGLAGYSLPHYNGNSGTYRAKIMRMRKHQCEECGYDKHPEVLQAHHIDHNRSNNHSSNLKLLCPTCHEVIHFLTRSGKYC